jgi:hypothetical protein
MTIRQISKHSGNPQTPPSHRVTGPVILKTNAELDTDRMVRVPFAIEDRAVIEEEVPFIFELKFE